MYYLDNENKSLLDCVQAIVVENETLAHLRHCQDSSEVKPPALKPRYVPAISPVYMVPKERDIRKTGA